MKTKVSAKERTNEKINEVIEKIISLIDSKNLLPWDEGFVQGALIDALLVNHISRRPYHGANAMMLLWMSIATLGEDFSGEHMTVAAAKKVYGGDAFPKKGSKTMPIFYPCFINEREKRYWKQGDDPADKKFVGMRYWNVLPIESFQKFDSGEIIPTARKHVRENVFSNEDVETFLKVFAERTELKVKRVNRAVTACYYPSLHEVVVSSSELYSSDERCYSTLFHEFVHSTAKTMARPTGTHAETEKYSAEELVAEFGALFLCEYFGIAKDSSRENSAAYLAGWKKFLSGEPKVLMTAINAAMRAVNYMLETAGLPKLSEAVEETTDSENENVEEKVA